MSEQLSDLYKRAQVEARLEDGIMDLRCPGIPCSAESSQRVFKSKTRYQNYYFIPCLDHLETFEKHLSEYYEEFL